MEDEGRLAIDSSKRMNDSATGRSGTLFAWAHIPAPSFEEGGKDASFDDGESDDEPDGSGNAVVKSERCFGVKFVIVVSRIRGYRRVSKWALVTEDSTHLVTSLTVVAIFCGHWVRHPGCLLPTDHEATLESRQVCR